MGTKKVLTLIFSILFVVAFAFCFTWGIINFNKVKDGMSGIGVYTQEDINNAYNDGYDTALKDKSEYTELIAGYRDTITTLNDNISQLNSQVNNLTNNNRDYANQVSKLNEQKSHLETQVNNLNTIKTNNEETISSLNTQITNLQNQVTTLTNSDENKSEQIAQLNTQILSLQNLVSQLQTTNNMNVDTITGLNVQIANLNNQISEMTLLSQNSTSQIANLNNKIAELQKSVTYYESYIAQLESGEQVVATFEYDGSVYNIQIVNKGSKLSVTTPTSTEYKIFNGWKVNGETIDLSTYTISQNTKIVADVTYKYDVVFKVDNDVYNSQVIVKNGIVTLPTNPTKTGYEFDGWSKNGVDVINNVQTILITENTTYQAVFTKVHNVTFKYEDVTKSTQSIRNGNYATSPTIENTDYKVFNGWKLNGNFVNLSTYKIVTDTTFVADLTYKYDVVFKVDNDVYNSQIIAKNTKPTLPETPVKSNYKFVGWTINGTDVVDVNNFNITENTTFTALFVLDKLNVTFKNGDTIISTQQVDNGGFATKPNYDSDTFMGWTLDGTNIVDVTTCQINQDTTFTAKFGTWKLFYDFFGDNETVVDYYFPFSNIVESDYCSDVCEKTFNVKKAIPSLTFNNNSKLKINFDGFNFGYESLSLTNYYEYNFNNNNFGSSLEQGGDGWSSEVYTNQEIVISGSFEEQYNGPTLKCDLNLSFVIENGNLYLVGTATYLVKHSYIFDDVKFDCSFSLNSIYILE